MWLARKISNAWTIFYNWFLFNSIQSSCLLIYYLADRNLSISNFHELNEVGDIANSRYKKCCSCQLGVLTFRRSSTFCRRLVDIFWRRRFVDNRRYIRSNFIVEFVKHVIRCETVLFNEKTCYTRRKPVIQRQNLLSNSKAINIFPTRKRCNPTRKRVIQREKHCYSSRDSVI